MTGHGPITGKEPRTLLVLARHGQTVWHAENRYAGVSDIGLTPHGVAQAARLAEWARTARLDRIVCSPVPRALETAWPSARATGLTPAVEDALREIDFGVAEGRTIAELRSADPDMVARFLADPVTHHFPQGEPPAEAADRATAALRDIAAAHPGRTVLVVAHNTIVRLSLCRLMGIDLRSYRTVFPRLRNCALTEVSLPPGGIGTASLLAFNIPLALGGVPAVSP
ncbi:histidine phosphatase family protein [Streptomyces sp. NPDC052236]|uniref:histidine phosphatase family protein n=1 Tax=Streptomyces sp. NPDC052236 TaxID=3365686 RepID=UPI0037D91224